MKISLQIISGKLHDRNAALHITQSGRSLMSARLLTSRARPFDPGAVYIGKTADILAMQNSGLPGNIVCVGKGDIRPLVEAGQYNIMYIGDGNPLDIHNEIQQIFDHYAMIDAELTDALLHEKDLQAILDICTRFFDNPVYIMDSAQKLIAVSSNMSNPESMDFQTAGYPSVDVVNRMKKLDLLDNKNGDPQLIQVAGIPPFLKAGIYENGEKIGAIGVSQQYSTLSENQLGLLQYVAAVLTVAISKENYARYVRSSYTNRFMLDMLSGTAFESGFILHNLSQLGWKCDDGYYIFKILPDPKDVEGGTVKYSGELIKAMYPGSVLLNAQDHLVLVVNTRFCQDNLEEAFQSLDGFLIKRNFTCGVSMLFKDFTLLCEHYKLAGAAIEIGNLLNKGRKLFRYTDYIMPHMISICDQIFNIRLLCHPGAVRLHEYDKATGNNYFYCLYIYLMHEKSLLNTAKHLNIHRSTLIYRLSKIAELINVDFNEHGTRMHLIFSYEILHFIDCLSA